ncbi:MAG TPA: DeoR/GlpR family DNA-binding transcription regulator [Aggregatilineaceae bacterium]|nr:DeoR/GlpR family DNA-binding transcription regulator [Aggregatilineaceae bacterium]
MTDPLFLEERRRAILDLLEQRGRITVKELSDEMQVSEVTIRQDLRALQGQGLLERTYGGAVLSGGNIGLKELAFNIRQMKMRVQKSAIAAQAASLIHDGSSIALDSSTTVYALMPYLKKFDNLTIVTNGLMAVQSFLDNDDRQARVLLTGGRLRRDSISVVGMPESLPNVNLNLCFFSARGIAENVGASEIDPDEVAIKQAMIARCGHAVLLVDGSKWGKVAPFTVSPTSKLQHIITSNDAPAHQVERFRELGIQVDVVDVR